MRSTRAIALHRSFHGRISASTPNLDTRKLDLTLFYRSFANTPGERTRTMGALSPSSLRAIVVAPRPGTGPVQCSWISVKSFRRGSHFSEGFHRGVGRPMPHRTQKSATLGFPVPQAGQNRAGGGARCSIKKAPQTTRATPQTAMIAPGTTKGLSQDVMLSPREL